MMGDKRTAIHEAGHAVMMVLLGVPVIKATIQSTDLYGGVVAPNVDAIDRAAPEDYAAIMYAGRIAEQIHFDEHDLFVGGASQDAEMACEKLRDHVFDTEGLAVDPDNDYIDELIAELENEAVNKSREFLQDNWQSVMAVSDELLARTTITGDRVSMIVKWGVE